jgi:hypothetical protein
MPAETQPLLDFIDEMKRQGAHRRIRGGAPAAERVVG